MFCGKFVSMTTYKYIFWQHLSHVCQLIFLCVTTHVYNRLCFMVIFCYTYVTTFILQFFYITYEYENYSVYDILFFLATFMYIIDFICDNLYL